MSAHAVRSSIERSLELAGAPEAAHVFTLLCAEAARADADVIDAARNARSRLPLAGVPVTVKDNFDLAGSPTTAGSVLLRDSPAAQADAPVVGRLRQKGFIVLGRTNMTEFAFSGLGLNPHYGTPANPAFPDEERIPGGSSSGAAVSVALGIAPLAIGTDTGGSIRIPAALCGLAGFKPTADEIDRSGVLPLSTTLDSVGMIGRSVGDCVTLFDAVRSVPRQRRDAPPARRIRLGLVVNYVTRDMDETTERALARAVAALEAAGVAVERIEVPELDGIAEMMAEATFPAAEAHAWHQPLLHRRKEYDPRVLARIEAGGRMPAGAYVRLTERRRALTEAVAKRTCGLDALIWATVPRTAPTNASLAEDSAYHSANALMLRNPTVVNLIDGCAFSIPCPGGGAPVGLSIAGPRGSDDHIIGIARRVESIFARS